MRNHKQDRLLVCRRSFYEHPNDAPLPYSPNISFTTLSAPFTSPVKISILKINYPMYCHAMVTAGRLASAAGVLLDRNAE